MKRIHPIAYILLFFAPAIPTVGQSNIPQNDNSTKTAVINFFVQVDGNSINQLVNIIDTQTKLGFRRFAILISSTGGETTSAFTAYNYLRGLNVEITTFNVGNVDSAATVLYCAGSKRYSLPNTRFLLHGASVGIPGPSMINAETLETQLALVNNQNQMMTHVISSTTKRKESEFANIFRSQTIWTPEEAKNWGLVQEIRNEFMGPDSVMVTAITPPVQPLPTAPQIRIASPIETSPDWKLSGTIQAPIQ